jgi:poly-D-alanine transfer protein DltD
MSIDYQRELEETRKLQQVLETKIDLLEQLLSVESSVGKADTVVAKTQNIAKSKSRRPAKRRSGGKKAQPQDKKMSLGAVIENIASQHKRSFTYKELASLAKSAGYESNSSNFYDMVYQALQKLLKRGTMVKDSETREYRYVG